LEWATCSTFFPKATPWKPVSQSWWLQSLGKLIFSSFLATFDSGLSLILKITLGSLKCSGEKQSF
jgi:hypothetical protein